MTASAVGQAVDWLKRRGTKRNRDGMARYGIVAPKMFGVSVATIRQLGKRLGRDHELAVALWKTGWYEARMLTAFIAEPARVRSAQMDRWARDFDNWAICDTLCFHLFDRTPHACGRSRSGVAGARNSCAGRLLPCWPPWHCMTGRRLMPASSARCRSSSEPRSTNGISSRKA